MKQFLLLLCVILMTACSYPDPEKHFINVDCTIVSFGQEIPATASLDSKTCYSVLLKLDGQDLYCSLSTCDDYQITTADSAGGCGCSADNVLTGEWFFNHRVGDKVHFTYIHKERFFQKRLEVVESQESSDSNSLSFYK